MFSPNIEGVLSIADRISKEATKDGALVSIESTIPRETSQKVFETVLHRLHVVDAPHRWYALEEKEHGVNQLRMIGGVSDCCLRAGMWFYNGSKDNYAISWKHDVDSNIFRPHRSLVPSVTFRGIVTFTIVAGAFVVGQVVILSMIKAKNNENKSKYYQHHHHRHNQPRERLVVVVDKTVTITQHLTAFLRPYLDC
jgi:hypothetical protein